MDDFLKNIASKSYLYALLIFIGYINYFTFYIFFGINIINYLTVGELLLSFLNLTIPLLFLGAFLLLLHIAANINIKSKSDEAIQRHLESTYRDNTEVFKGSFKNLKWVIKNWKWKSFGNYISLLLSIYQFTISVGLYIFLVAYPLELFAHISGSYFIYDADFIMMLMLAFIWFLTFDDVLERIYEDIETRRAILNTSLVLCFIGFITYINRMRAKTILDDKKSNKVEFVYENKEIKTDSILMYIGQTKDYIFLRNSAEKSTEIYSKSKIYKITYLEE